MSVDADWTRRHTRLGLRANEWDDRSRDGSFLLRGSDLREAEGWRDEQAGKEPPPTALQLAYLSASRRAAARRRRFTLGAVLFALTVAVGLAVVAVLQRQDAIRQRDQALSLALATAAADEVTRAPDIALLLSLEANEVSPTPQARSSATAALEAAWRSGAEAVLHGAYGPVSSVALSADGRTLATADGDGTVRLWDLAEHRQLGAPLTGHTDRVYGVAFSPDGRTLASASADKTVRLWDVQTHRQLGRPLDGHTREVRTVVFSPDGRTLASGGFDGMVLLWDVRTRRQLGRPLARHRDPVDAVAFAPDGHTIAEYGLDGRIRLWDVRTRRQLGRPLGPTGYGRSVAFSPDGRILASSADDGMVRLWDTRAFRQLGRPLQRGREVGSVAFSPNGRRLASGADDGTVRLWDLRQPPAARPDADGPYRSRLERGLQRRRRSRSRREASTAPCGSGT